MDYISILMTQRFDGQALACNDPVECDRAAEALPQIERQLACSPAAIAPTLELVPVTATAIQIVGAFGLLEVVW